MSTVEFKRGDRVRLVGHRLVGGAVTRVPVDSEWVFVAWDPDGRTGRITKSQIELEANR